MTVLRHVDWSPECARAHILNIPKVLLSRFQRPLVEVGNNYTQVDEAYKKEGAQQLKLRVEVHSHGVAVDKTGMTVCTLMVAARVVCRNVFVNGTSSTREHPVGLDEAVILHAPRSLLE